MRKNDCPKCLLTELNSSDSAEIIKEQLSLIPEEEKTPSDEYENRLKICRSCLSLTDVICAECGCFVQIRAAKRRMGCPVNKWRKL